MTATGGLSDVPSLAQASPNPGGSQRPFATAAVVARPAGLSLRLTELRLPLDHDEPALRRAAAARLSLPESAIVTLHVFRRGYDARKRSAIELVYTVDLALDDAHPAAQVLARHAADPHVKPAPQLHYQPVGERSADFWARRDRPRPVVVGFGPCGLFAALVLAQMGLRPIVLERGRAVRERTQDTWALWRRSELHAESNVQFGEGGAGTFSDGKLWSQISDPRHLTRKVLDEFVKAGAPEEILFVSKPHIGTFRLVSMIEKMRAEIVSLGGEIRFGHRLLDLRLEPPSSARPGRGDPQRSLVLRGLRVATPEVPTGIELDCEQLVLAPGHSARDTFAMLVERGVALQAKPFSIGFRIEHPQSLIDRARFGASAGHPLLGAADYKLVHHAPNGRSVYSFCMCPGGTVVAATSEPERVVTNGMSQYSRNERNANAGIVVGISPQDYRQDGGDRAPSDPVSPLDGIAFQRLYESRAFRLGEGGYRAPAQRVEDFLAGRPSRALGSVQPSYRPGVTPTDLGHAREPALPIYAIEAIRSAIPAFDRQIRGFAMPDAVFTGVETRTSSPLRIPRLRDGQSLNVAGLFPAGEGAGYAGGIMSAGVDGIEAAEAVARAMLGIDAAQALGQRPHAGPA